MKTGAGSIDGDVGMRFPRADAAVAAITEAIDCSACDTSAGRDERGRHQLSETCSRAAVRLWKRSEVHIQQGSGILTPSELHSSSAQTWRNVTKLFLGARSCGSDHPWVNAISAARPGPLRWTRTTVGRRRVHKRLR